jgi:thiol-disulfide isomerase/thioredoxin
MKNYYFLLLVLLFSCKNSTQTILTGVIENPKSEYVHLTIGDSLLTQKLDKTNSFKFNVNINKSGYYRFDHEEHTLIYLVSGKSLQLKLDTKSFDESLQYSGDLAAENNYIARKALEFEKVKKNRNKLYKLNKKDFNHFIDSTTSNFHKELSTIKNSDSIFHLTEEKEIEEFKQLYLKNYDKMYFLQEGNIAPDFTCKDKNGKDFSLKNFKGKALCIDVWATWCAGCLKEMPNFENLKEKYSDKIHFISISVDDDKDKWINTIQKKDMKDIQLWAEKGKDSEFVLSYNLLECGVPCFILIDKDGRIINVRGPRPSENLEELLINITKQI